MPYDEYNKWSPLPEKRWLPDGSAIFCQVMDKTTFKRCTVKLHWGNRHHCRECGILVCSRHCRNQYYGHKVCDHCYTTLEKGNHWKPLPQKEWLPDGSAIFCQVMDKTTFKRCTVKLHWGNRHHCRECGILVCTYHSKYRYQGCRVCDICYRYLLENSRRKKFIPVADSAWRTASTELDNFFSNKTNLLGVISMFQKNLFCDQEAIISTLVLQNHFNLRETNDYIALHNIEQALQRYTNIPKELCNQQTRIYFLESQERWPWNKVMHYWNSINL